MLRFTEEQSIFALFRSSTDEISDMLKLAFLFSFISPFISSLTSLSLSSYTPVFITFYILFMSLYLFSFFCLLPWTIINYWPSSTFTPDSFKALSKWLLSKQIAVAVFVLLFFWNLFKNEGTIWIFLNCILFCVKNPFIYLHFHAIGTFITLILRFELLLWFFSWAANFTKVWLLFKSARKLLFSTFSSFFFSVYLTEELRFLISLIERVRELLWFWFLLLSLPFFLLHLAF